LDGQGGWIVTHCRNAFHCPVNGAWAATVNDGDLPRGQASDQVITGNVHIVDLAWPTPFDWHENAFRY